MKNNARKQGFVPPVHINAKAHRRLMAKLRKMKPGEVLAAAVRAGIYTEDGQLTEHYASGKKAATKA